MWSTIFRTEDEVAAAETGDMWNYIIVTQKRKVKVVEKLQKLIFISSAVNDGSWSPK